MSIEKELNNLNDIFNLFDDPKDKFVQLMDMGKESKQLSEKEKIDQNKIFGCTSQAWVIGKPNGDNTFTFKTVSDALIVKGLLTILEKIFNGQSTKEILKIKSHDILIAIGLDKIITSQRTNGFSNAVIKIQTIVK